MKQSPLRRKRDRKAYRTRPSLSRVWKSEDPSPAQVSENVLRPYLIHSHRALSQDYPILATMSPEEAADHLLRLRKIHQIQINLTSTGDKGIKCQILGPV